MFKALFGNNSIEKILFFILRYGNGYPNDMASIFNMRISNMQRQLKRLENGGILASKLYGKVRLYQFNPRYPFLGELKIMLNKAFKFIPKDEIYKYYMRRTRPRLQGKPL